jgi:alkyl hydroperoxide reductase subunit AhpF
MPLIKDDDRKLIAGRLGAMSQDVVLHMFTQEHECRYCEMTRQMVEEVGELSPRVRVEVHDFVADQALAQRYGVDKVPAIAVVGARDYGIRFYGIPAGYEFTPFLDAILDVGRGDPGLPAPILAELARIDRPVHLQVMVTPT